jgi:hypothetical protein
LRDSIIAEAPTDHEGRSNTDGAHASSLPPPPTDAEPAARSGDRFQRGRGSSAVFQRCFGCGSRQR